MIFCCSARGYFHEFLLVELWTEEVLVFLHDISAKHLDLLTGGLHFGQEFVVVAQAHQSLCVERRVLVEDCAEAIDLFKDVLVFTRKQPEHTLQPEQVKHLYLLNAVLNHLVSLEGSELRLVGSGFFSSSALQTGTVRILTLKQSCRLDCSEVGRTRPASFPTLR